MSSKIKSNISAKRDLIEKISHLEKISNHSIFESDMVSDRTEKAIIFDYVNMSGSVSNVVDRLSLKHSVSKESVKEIITGKSPYWGVVRVMHGLLFETSNSKTRRSILKMNKKNH